MGLSEGYPTIDQKIDLLIQVARLVEPVKHEPGSIELRIGFFDVPKIVPLLNGMQVAKEAQGIPGILGYKVHILSTSATIAYDPEIIPFDLWSTFCQIKTEPQAEKAFRAHLKQLIPG